MKLSNLFFTLLLFVFTVQITNAQQRRPEKPNLNQSKDSCEKQATLFWNSVNAMPWQNLQEFMRAVQESSDYLVRDSRCASKENDCFTVSDDVMQILLSSRWSSRAELMQIYQNQLGKLAKDKPTCAESYILLQKTDVSAFSSGR